MFLSDSVVVPFSNLLIENVLTDSAAENFTIGNVLSYLVAVKIEMILSDSAGEILKFCN